MASKVEGSDECVCEPCDCDGPPVSGGDACVCPNPPCDCGRPPDECICKPCECDDPKDLCLCDPCLCETPPGSPKARPEGDYCEAQQYPLGFTLNEFIRAKEYFLTTSTNSGINLYDHMSEVLRKMLDSRAPPNSVDFLEELSLNMKRYRFGPPKDLIKDSFYLSPSLAQDASSLLDTWKQHALWSKFVSEEGEGEGRVGYGGFPNLMRLVYYLEHINIGLPRQEMFRLALSLRQLNLTHPVKRSRFWGKVFGISGSYYVVEAELIGKDEVDLWVEGGEEAVPPPQPTTQLTPANPNFITGTETYARARSAVTDPTVLIPYQETSGVPPGPINCVPSPIIPPADFLLGEGEPGEVDVGPVDPEGAAEALLWSTYQTELMEGFPAPPKPMDEVIVGSEEEGQGVNRRSYYVATDLNEKWTLLPSVTPKQIQISRDIRRFLTGKLDDKMDVHVDFGGREAHYLKCLLARLTAGAQVSPEGYYRRTPQLDDEDEEDVEEEEEEETIGDIVYPVLKYGHPNQEQMGDLLAVPPSHWVHHVSYILKQGRTTWWNPPVTRDPDEEELGEDEEEEEGGMGEGPELRRPLFSRLAEDATFEGFSPWTPRSSSTLFTEFQIAYMKSNLWPGATAFCTHKGKVENVYMGDGLKFRGTSYAPPVPPQPETEFKEGPELEEVNDPTYAQEQEWLNKIELEGLNDVEQPFGDNEETDEGEEETTEDED